MRIILFHPKVKLLIALVLLPIAALVGTVAGAPGDNVPAGFSIKRISTGAPALEFDLVAAATYPTNGTYVPSDKYYGPGFEMESLANTVVGTYPGSGGENITVAHRFRAQKSGTLSTAQFYFAADATNTGYSRGNGGTIRISIQTNNPSANTPSGTIVGTPIVYVEPFANGINSDVVFKVLTFPLPRPQLTQGQLYHIVFENIHAQPDLNYLSVDDAYVGDQLQTPREPLIPDLELETLLRFGTGSWSKRPSHVPIHALTYTDGFVQGQTYMEVWFDRTNGSTTGIISGNQMVRQSLTPTQSKTASKVHVRVGRVSGSSPLTISLTRSDGTVVGQGTVPASSVVLENGFRGNHVWVATFFCPPVTLIQGQTYYLTLSAPSDTSYKMFAIREGTSYFPAALSFSDGQAAVTANGSIWTGWVPWPGALHTETLADLQMYFDLVPSAAPYLRRPIVAGPTFSFIFRGVLGRMYTVEATDFLSQSIWNPVGVFHGTDDMIQFIYQMGGPGGGCRFFRVREEAISQNQR